MARNAGIIVSGVPAFPPGSPIRFAEVELIDADTDEAVPLREVAWYSLGDQEQTLALHPVEPLAPLRDYRIEATPLLFQGDGSEGDVAVSSFVSSDVLLEPILLSGEIGLSLRGDAVDIVASGLCGGSGGAVTGQRRALLADVELPAPSGGQGVYRGVLYFSDHTPIRVNTRAPWDYDLSDAELHEMRMMQFEKLEAGEVLTLEQEVFEQAAAYAGCFTWVVWDPAGHIAQASRCLPVLSPDDVRALAQSEESLDIAADDAIAAADVQSAAAEYRAGRPPAFACSFDARAPTRTPGWLTLLLASMYARRISRRR